MTATAFLSCTDLFDGALQEILSSLVADPGPSAVAGEIIEDRLRQLAGFIRSGLDLPYFPFAGIDLERVEPEPLPGASADLVGPPGSRRIGFVIVIGQSEGADPGDSGVSVRLFDSEQRDGRDAATDTSIDVPVAANSVVLFPGGRHVELRGISPFDGPIPGRLVFMGSIVEGPSHRSGAIAEERRYSDLRRRYLPRFTEGGFELRPTPIVVQQFLESLLAMRSSEVSSPSLLSDDVVDISRYRFDLLRSLRKSAMSFAGTPMVGSSMVGLCINREGATVAVQNGRVESDVVTVLVQVALDAEAPWPVVLERDGIEWTVPLSAGQMLLVESATMSWSQPVPFQGRSSVTIIATYRPLDWPWTVERLAEQLRVDLRD